MIRTSGEEGEQLLLKLMKYHKNEKVRMAASSVLSYRLPADTRQIQVEILLDANEQNLMESKSYFTPGQVCKYSGPINSLILEENERSHSEQVFEQDAVMQVSMRDFIASLLRMVNLKNEYFVE